jgi:two-component system nitrogen regulation sensor histidine kinase GlnL
MVATAPRHDIAPARTPGISGLAPAALLDALTWPVIAADRELLIVYANPAAAELFGIGLRTFVGLSLADIWGEQSIAQSLVERVRREGTTLTEDALAVTRPDGQALRISLDATPLDHDPSVGVLIAMRDRTVSDRLDRQASRRDGARSFGAMAAMLAHEVRNPLAGIRGAAQLIAPSLDAGDRNMTILICQEVDRIVSVLDSVETLASGRLTATAPENIHEILDYVCKIAQAGVARDRRIVRTYDPSLPLIAADRALLIQAFFNLVKNAAEATESIGGEIRLGTRFDPGLVRLAADGTRRKIPVVVSVADNGPGIPEAVREHLFDPFMTTKPQGRGLGLALVARIVADHEGAIDVTSEPRRTRFDVMLPVADPGTPQ